MSEGLPIHSRRHRCFLAIEPGQGIVWYKHTNAERAGMDREESCVEKLVKVLHQEDSIPGVPGILPCFLKPTRTLLHRTIIITMLPTGAGVEMVMLLRDDMAGPDARPNRRPWAPWLSLAGDGTTSCSVKTRGPKLIDDPLGLFEVYIHTSRGKHVVEFVIVNVVRTVLPR
jgi:hypothetical protein